MEMDNEKVRLVTRGEKFFSMSFWFYKSLEQDIRNVLNADYWRRMDFSNPKYPKVFFSKREEHAPKETVSEPTEPVETPVEAVEPEITE